MRVLIVTPEFPPDEGGGIITYYRDLVAGFVGLGCEVAVLRGSAYVHGDAIYQFGNVTVCTLETARFESWVRRFEHFAVFPDLQRHLAASFALHEQAKAGDGYDAVEVTDWGLLFIPWMLDSRSPVLVQLHGSCGQIAFHEPVGGREADGTLTLLLERSGLALASCVTSHSSANVHWWENMLSRKVSYLPPPHQSTICRTSVASRVGWLVVGRIQRWKGPHVACAAWRHLGAQAPVLNWYGRDTRHGETGLSTNRWLETTYPDIWGKTIVPHPPLAPVTLRTLLEGTKVVVIPSEWDAFNLVTVEAMAAGCIVLVSTGAGASDMIDHGKNGFQFPVGDDAALAELVRNIKRMDVEQLESISRSACDSVHARLAPGRIAQEKMALYKSAGLPCGQGADWLRHTLLQNSTSSGDFLDQLSIRRLGKYLLHRLAGKLF